MEQKVIMKKPVLIPTLITVVCSLLMVLTIFMPYAAATKEQSERLRENSDFYSLEELNMEGKDLINISMTEYAKVYSNMSEELFGDSAAGKMYVAFVALIAAFCVAALVFGIFQKPVAIIIFDVLAFLVFCLQSWDYKDRGVIPSTGYDWGAAYYVFIIAAIVLLIGSIWMMIAKNRSKKTRRSWKQ